MAISALGQTFKEKVFKSLLDSLKDASINKAIVCETLVKLGIEGERVIS